jgi:hypothetical protein
VGVRTGVGGVGSGREGGGLRRKVRGGKVGGGYAPVQLRSRWGWWVCASFTLYVAFVAGGFIATVGGVDCGCSGGGRVLECR